jgi:integrase
MTKRGNSEGSIYRCSHGYGAYAWIDTPDGRRQRKYVYGKTREDVRERWLKLTVAARRGPVPASAPSLAEFLRRWLEETVKPTLAPTTAANYELFVRAYIVPDLGRKRIDRLAVRDVQSWLNDLKTRCQCCAQGKDAKRAKPRCCARGECCQQVASEWTRHQAWTVLHGALSAAVREDLLSRNVASMVRVPTPRARRVLVWTADQSRAFLDNAKRDDDPYYAAYVLMLVLGLRRGEVLGLSWEDVDLAREQAWIGWQVQRVKGSLVRRPTKTEASDAYLPLPGMCVRALEGRREEQEWHRAALQDEAERLGPLRRALHVRVAFAPW